jgi:hypothetical protein
MRRVLYPPMLARPLRIAAILASLFVVLGWGLFALDQARGASHESVAGIAGDPTTYSDPSPDQEKAREKIHSKPREFVDDVNDILLSPFAGVSDGSKSKWVRRSVPALIALLVYGFGGGYLARFAAGRA